MKAAIASATRSGSCTATSIAIDTNVLVRIIADDPGQPEQVAAARALASEAGEIFVPTVVQVETVWVLESGYGLPKATIVLVLAGCQDRGLELHTFDKRLSRLDGVTRVAAR